MMRRPALLTVVILFSNPVAGQNLPAAVPVDPFDAIATALTTYQLIGIGEGAHRGVQDETFRVALVRHARIAERANDLVTECGNSRYQDVMDAYVSGENVPNDVLRRTWEDSIVPNTACDATVYQEFFAAVREANTTRPADRRWRVLLGGPPIDWDQVKTFADLTAFESDRDRFAAELIRREVLAKGRRALIMYGRIHMLPRDERTNFESAQTLTAQLEAGGVPVFKVWTVVGQPNLAALQPDVASWSVPSLAIVRGTQLGALDFTAYFPSDGRLASQNGKVVAIPQEQWRAMPMQQLVDALLYLGGTVTYARIPPSLCRDSNYMRMRLTRMALVPGGDGEIELLKRNCGNAGGDSNP